MILPFSKGLNFTKWFEAPSPQLVVFSKITEQDFIDVKSIGVDVIRLPVKMHNMAGAAPEYVLDPHFFNLLDQVVDWAEKHQIYLILDNHSFHPVAPTDPGIGGILIPVWTQLARRYKDRSAYILYEILNEPHGIDAKVCAAIQEKVVSAIRAIDSKHSIVVGGVNYNSLDELLNVPIYPCDHIVYTFHFYDPHIFTHQGETWGHPPNLRNLKGLPFPSDAHAMPEIPPDLKGSWAEKTIKNTYMRDATVETLSKQLDKALEFSRKNGDVPLFCGEFGAHIPNILPEDRLRWYQIVTRLLDERKIARASWDYFGSFGIFKTAQGGSFTGDLNVEIVKALGFSVPPSYH
jgi:endoglucanase